MYIGWPVCGKQGLNTISTGLSGYRGLGCGCGCNGNGNCGSRGLGQLSTPFGTLFSSGWDISGWGWGEAVVVLLGLYVLMSVFQTTSRGARRASRTYRRIATRGERKRKEKAEELRRQARFLEGDDLGSSRRRSRL